MAISNFYQESLVWRNYHTWQSGQDVRKRFADEAPDRKFAGSASLQRHRHKYKNRRIIYACTGTHACNRHCRVEFGCNYFLLNQIQDQMCLTGTALLRGDEMGEKEKTRSATVFFLFANLKKEKAVFSES